jgi:hypothetical protein
MNDRRIKRDLPDFAKHFSDDQIRNGFLSSSGNFSENNTEHLTLGTDSHGIIEVLESKELILEGLNHFREYSIEVSNCGLFTC